MNHLVARARGLILSPLQEWRVIAGEPVDMMRVLTGYVAILAAIPAVGGLIGGIFVGLDFGMLILGTVLSYVLGIVSVLVLAKIIEVLAPKFGAPQDAEAALKLAAFAPTASWVAGAALMIPGLGGLVALAGGIYSLYTFYIGAPTVARVPSERMLPFAFSVIGVAVLVNLVIAGVIAVLV